MSKHCSNNCSHNTLNGANLILADRPWLIGTSDGIIRFEPSKLVINPVPPTVYLQTLTYTKQGNSKSTETIVLLNDRSKLKLEYNENGISFQYVGIHCNNPALNKYKYQLIGCDKDWIKAGTQRTVTYTNLSPGTYTFHVKACNSDGIWNETGASFTFTTLPPWWEPGGFACCQQ